MKRLKKIWIACAALAVVVALCALALLYRPIPYRFLEGSRFEKSEVVDGPKADNTMSSYRLRGTMDTVVERAQAELTLKEGWDAQRRPGEVHIRNGDKAVIVSAVAGMWASEEGRYPDEPGTVLVLVVEPATPIERFVDWLHTR